MPTTIELVSSLDLPELMPYRTLRRPREHFEQRMFIAEGEKVVRRLLASPLRIRSMLLTPEWKAQLSAIPRFTTEEMILYVADHPLLEQIVGYNLHQGLMAIGELPEDPPLIAILKAIHQAGAGLIVALDGLVNAENVGVIVRNCSGLGVQLILSGENSSSPYLRRAVRNSMGTVFRLPVVHVTDLAGTLRMLRERYSYKVLAADPRAPEVIYRTDLRGNVCVAVGNEGDGLTQRIAAACTTQISIPMMNDTDSLNVANSVAVILSEAMRQREFVQGQK